MIEVDAGRHRTSGPDLLAAATGMRPDRVLSATVSVPCQTGHMTNVDVAKLKRLRSAVSSALDHVPEKSLHGLPPTYNALREQVAAAVPPGLHDELENLAPQITSTGHGPHAIIERAQDGAQAYARLAALKGWLDAVIDAE